MAWAERKVKQCIDILRAKIRRGRGKDAIDLAEDALWSKDPDVRDARGYLEAWADVADMTVGEFVAFIESKKRIRFTLTLEHG